MQKKFPARIHVVFAANSPKAVVFRRGPSKEVCTVLWNREKDSFEIGQWLRGRIYERRSDLSPDGNYLIYFAKGKYSSKTGGSWTAVSKAPWLRAIDLYAKGDCWEGGGLFLSSISYWLNDRYFTLDKILLESNKLHRQDDYSPEGSFGAECTGVYYRRLIRDGWQIVGKQGHQLDSVTIFEKQMPKNWVMKKIAHEQVGAPPGKGCYWDEHELVNTESGEKISCDNWEWAELDKNTVVYACEGKLFRSKILTNKKIDTAKMLYDFNNMEFEAIEAPYAGYSPEA